MNFEVLSSEVRFAHLNVRTETHGEEERTALDLKLQWSASNDALLLFHQRLRAAIFTKPPANQADVAGLEPSLSVRAFPEMAPLHWKAEFTGMVLAIHHAMDEGRDLRLGPCKVDGFVIEPLDGGTCVITFRAQCLCEDERVLGKLPLLLHRTLPMTIRRSRSAAAAAADVAANEPFMQEQEQEQEQES